MTRKSMLGLLAAGFVAAACSSPKQSEAARQGGSLALSADDRKLFVADADNDELLVVDTASEKVVARVKVGRWPERVVVASDGRVFVSNRHARSVSVVDPAAAREVARIEVGAEPRGLALSPDGRTLVVANAMSHTLSVVDVGSLQVVGTVKTPAGDPRGVTVLPGGKAVVTYERSEKISVFDIATNSLRTPMSLTLSPEKTQFETRVAGLATDPVYNADDGRVYVPHVQSKEDPIATDVDIGGGNAYAGGGATGTVPVVANALATLDPEDERVLDAPGIEASLFDCFDCGLGSASAASDVPPVMTLTSGPLSGPVAAALNPDGEWLFVVNMNSNNVSLIATNRSDTRLEPVPVGAGPSGIAIAKAGDRAWVYNSFDQTVSVLEAADGGVTEAREFKVAESPLTPEQNLGRKLFFAADDPRMTNASAGGIACASCHPSGREDGRTWQFSEGPRNTPTLAGRKLSRSAPYHWDGLLQDMHDFRMVVEERMGGSGTRGGALTATDFNAMLAFLETLPGPDNPNRLETLTEAQARGEELFRTSAQCVTCHTGPDFTDNRFYDVGTHVLSNPRGNPDRFPLGGVNVPPLHNLFATAPYLHDGSVATLRERVKRNPGDRHGVTSHLTESEIDDLVAYLETL